MRSSERIRPFIRALSALWLLVPDQRFGQLVMNLTRDENGRFEEPFNWEESEWLRRIDAYYQRELERSDQA